MITTDRPARTFTRTARCGHTYEAPKPAGVKARCPSCQAAAEAAEAEERSAHGTVQLGQWVQMPGGVVGQVWSQYPNGMWAVATGARFHDMTSVQVSEARVGSAGDDVDALFAEPEAVPEMTEVTISEPIVTVDPPTPADLASMPAPDPATAVQGIPAPVDVSAPERTFTLADGRTTLNAPYADLRAGDQYVRGITAGRPVVVTVLRDEHETWIDRFGRTMFKLWARREDTGAEGWDTYGPDGMADRVSSEAVSARPSTTAPNNGSIGGMDYVNGRRPVGWRKASDVTDAQLAEAYGELRSTRAVGERFDIPHPTVRARLLAAGVTLRPRGREAGNSGRAPSHDLGGDVVRRIVEMRAEGWSFPTIAADVGVPAQSARRYHALAMVYRRCRPDLPEQDNPATDEELSAGSVGELLRAARAAGAGDVQLASASGLTVDQVEALIGAARPS
jgi:hypothetical protein